MMAMICYHLPITSCKRLAYHGAQCVADRYLDPMPGGIHFIVPFLKDVVGRLLKQPNRTLQLTS